MSYSSFFFQLEEGEIDVRLNSFKGCLSQQSNNIYSQTNNNVDLDGNYVLNWNKMLHVLMMDGHQVTQMIFKDFNGITTIYIMSTWHGEIWLLALYIHNETDER